MTPAEVFWSGVVVGAVVMAALIELAWSAAAEVNRLLARTDERRTALPKVRW